VTGHEPCPVPFEGEGRVFEKGESSPVLLRQGEMWILMWAATLWGRGFF
jgi:hypothetical protein